LKLNIPPCFVIELFTIDPYIFVRCESVRNYPCVRLSRTLVPVKFVCLKAVHPTRNTSHFGWRGAGETIETAVAAVTLSTAPPFRCPGLGAQDSGSSLPLIKRQSKWWKRARMSRAADATCLAI